MRRWPWPLKTERQPPPRTRRALVVGGALASAGLWAAASATMARGTDAMSKPAQEPPQKTLPVPGEVFQVQGRTAFLILPARRPSRGPLPWVWYAPTLRPYPGREETWMFEQFLARGIGIAGVDVGESYGSPAGVALYTAFYEELTARRGLAPKPALLARSRGGLMLYNWAAEHPQAVACVAGIYPVCNLRSYPGLEKACAAYGLSAAELERELPRHNPIERLAPLARAGVPIFHLHGDRDTVVPLEQNSGAVAQRYAQLGGTMTLEVVAGGGHDLAPAWFHSRKLVDFVIAAVGR